MTKLQEQKSINWKQELLDSQRFNKKEEKLLKDGAKNIVQSWWLSAMYLRYKQMKNIKEKPRPNLQSSFKEFERKIIED